MTQHSGFRSLHSRGPKLVPETPETRVQPTLKPVSPLQPLELGALMDAMAYYSSGGSASARGADPRVAAGEV
jgi:hypothetical protein